MKTIDFTSLIGSSGLSTQATLAKAMRRVCEANSPVTLDGAGKDRVVMMSLDAYKKLNSSQETICHDHDQKKYDRKPINKLNLIP